MQETDQDIQWDYWTSLSVVPSHGEWVEQRRKRMTKIKLIGLGGNFERLSQGCAVTICFFMIGLLHAALDLLFSLIGLE